MADFVQSSTDPGLLSRIRKDPSNLGWSEFVSRYSPKIRAWCRHWGLQQADVDEVTQIVLVKLVEKMKVFRYDPARSFRAWLKTVTHHAWRDYVESQRRAVRGSGDSQVRQALETVEAGENLLEHLDEEFERAQLEEALERMRERVEEKTWQAFHRLTFQEQSGRKVADALGMEIGAGLHGQETGPDHPARRVRQTEGAELGRVGQRRFLHRPATLEGWAANMDSCPTDDYLQLLLTDQLDAAARQTLETHLQDCTCCEERLAHLTVAQFQRFLDANPEVKRSHTYIKRYSPQDDGPITTVSWFQAIQYCNWLSKQEGIPEDQWCYPPIDMIREGMELPRDYLHRAGYRLPTEAEWEYACRGGARTSRFYGSSAVLLKEYAWYSTTTNNERTWPVGQLKPNDLGLFDLMAMSWSGARIEPCPTRPKWTVKPTKIWRTRCSR